jgi:hypothetical protein
MKRALQILPLALALSGAVPLPAADVPNGFNYQGRLLDASGAPLSDGNYNVTFRIYNSASGSAMVWGPQTIQVPLVDGLFNAVLGPTDSSPNSRPILEAFDAPERHLELQIGGNSPISPRQRILAVPFAIRSESAGTADLAAKATSSDQVRGKDLLDDSFNIRIDRIQPGSLSTALFAPEAVTKEKLDPTIGTWTTSGGNIYYSSGNVGIGLDNPQNRLHVTGGIRTDSLLFGHGSMLVGDQGGAMELGSPSAAAGQKPYIDFHYGGYAGGAEPDYSARLQASAINRLEITTGNIVLNGRVGIGTDSPQLPFHVHNAGDDLLRLTREGQARRWDMGVGGSVAPGSFFIARGDIGVRDFTISSSGNVGIGTTTPAERLHVAGNFLGNGVFIGVPLPPPPININDPGAETIRLKSRFGPPPSGFRRGPELVFQGQSANSVISLHSETPNVLQIAGAQLRLQDIGEGTGISLVWDSSRQVRRLTSSLRYKERVQPMQEDVEALLRLEAKRFAYRSQPDDWQIGYIAEDLDALGLKALTIYDEEGRPEAVDYAKMIVFANEILKEQQERLNAQQSEIDNLKREIDALSQMVRRGTYE